MNVHPAEPASGKLSPLDEAQHLVMVREWGLRKVLQKGQDFTPLFEMSERDLTDDEWVSRDFAFAEQ